MSTQIRTHRGALPGPVVDGVRALAAAALAQDGVEALGEQTILDLTGGADVLHLLAGDDASPTDPFGYLQVSRPGADGGVSGELVVHPDRRRRGTGRALLEAARTAAGANGDRLAVWAHGDLAGARALATAAGLHQVRALWRMSHDLTRLPPVGALPTGVVVRPFVVGADEGAWLEVNARAFARHPEQGRMVLADLRAREGAPWFRAEDLILAERHGALVGFVWLKVEPGEPVGELYVLGVDPRAQGGGLGAGLTRLALTHLADRGVRRVVLYTEGDNAAARRTYTAVGFRRDRVDAQYG